MGMTVKQLRRTMGKVCLAELLDHAPKVREQDTGLLWIVEAKRTLAHVISSLYACEPRLYGIVPLRVDRYWKDVCSETLCTVRIIPPWGGVQSPGSMRCTIEPQTRPIAADENTERKSDSWVSQSKLSPP